MDNTEVKKESKISGKTKFWGIVIIIVLVVLAVYLVVPRKANIAKRRAAEIMTAVENLKQEVDDYWKEHDGGGGFVMSEAWLLPESRKACRRNGSLWLPGSPPISTPRR